jgi:hypothetical protein
MKHSENDKDISFVANNAWAYQKPELIRGVIGDVNN